MSIVTATVTQTSGHHSVAVAAQTAGITAAVQAFVAAGGTGLLGTVFEVDSYGAVGDGGTDDSLAWRDAYLAAAANSAGGAISTVHFTPGKNYRIASGWNMPTIRTNDSYGYGSPTVQRAGLVFVSGYGATISWPNGATGRFGFLQAPNPGGSGSTYGNLVIQGLGFDNNWRKPSADWGTILAVVGSGVNVDNVIVRDCRTFNVLPRTGLANSCSVLGIMLQNGSATGQSFYSYTTGVGVYNCDIQAASKPLAIVMNGQEGTGATKHVIDLIDINGGTYDNVGNHGSSIHLGESALGYRASVQNVTVQNCTDDGLEVDAFNEVMVKNITAHNVRQAICFTWFSYPYMATLPDYTVDGFAYSGLCGPYYPPAGGGSTTLRSPMMPELRIGATAPPAVRSFGNFIIKNGTAEFGVANAYGYHAPFIMLGSNGVPMESVGIDNVDITDVGSGGTLVSINQGSQLGRILPISLTDVRWRNSAGGAYALLPASKVALGGAHTLTTDIAGLY